MDDEACRSDDLTGGWTGVLLWRVPLVLIAVGLIWRRALFWTWIPAFLVSGTSCLVNAARCHRTHCYLTGPLYLAAALYLVVAGLGRVPLDEGAFLLVVFGLALAAVLSERVVGRYREA